MLGPPGASALPAERAVRHAGEGELAGRPTEVGLFADRVVALGRQQGVPTPYNQAMSWILS